MYKFIPRRSVKGWVLLFLIPLCALALPSLLLRVVDDGGDTAPISVNNKEIGYYRCEVLEDFIIKGWDCGDAHIFTASYDMSGYLEDAEDSQVYKDFLLGQVYDRFLRAIALNWDANAQILRDTRLVAKEQGFVAQNSRGAVIMAYEGTTINLAYVGIPSVRGSMRYATPFIELLEKNILTEGEVSRDANFV